jgi:GH18 family chitinase
MDIVREFNLDGVDIDWEYPDPIEPSSSNFVLLMKELSDSLHAAGKKLSAAVVSHDDSNGYGISEESFPYADWINIMAYDYQNERFTPHSPYWLAVRSLDYWVDDRGLPRDKAILGVNLARYKRMLARGANPYADLYDSSYYNGITTIQKKTELALKRGGGIMIWEITSDTTGPYSLLKAIHEVVIRKNKK